MLSSSSLLVYIIYLFNFFMKAYFLNRNFLFFTLSKLLIMKIHKL